METYAGQEWRELALPPMPENQEPLGDPKAEEIAEIEVDDPDNVQWRRTSSGWEFLGSDGNWYLSDAHDEIEEIDTEPALSAGYSESRVRLVQEAVKDWVGSLIDLGGRNNLLHYRDLRSGTLDLTKASETAIAALLRGRPVKVSSMFRENEERIQGLRRTRAIHKKAKENFEERGIETLSLACGLATWENKRATWKPSAPVLLRRAVLRPVGAAQDEFELQLSEEMEINPTLLHSLRVDFGCEFDHDSLFERMDGVIDEPWELEESYSWLREQAKAVPDLQIESRLILANFAYAKLPMVNDLQQAFDELVGHELIAAIAGDEDARETVRGTGPDPDSVPRPDDIPLSDEFLVLDADSSQNYAINSILAGRSLIIKGPPGTGKSQTIANLIASCMARRKRVLFVAEKRAAIDAVTKRLSQHHLDDLILDLHGKVASRRAFAASIGETLANLQSVPRTSFEELRYTEDRRERLNTYATELHRVREPWGLSVYAIRAELLGLKAASNGFRFRGSAIEALGAVQMRQLQDDLGEYLRLGGLSLTASTNPWIGSPVASNEDAQHAYSSVDRLRRELLPKCLGVLEAGAQETGLPVPSNLRTWRTYVEVWKRVEGVSTVFSSEVYGLDLAVLCQAYNRAAGSALTRFGAVVSSSAYREARRCLREVGIAAPKSSDELLYRHAAEACEVLTVWRDLGGESRPSAPQLLEECLSGVSALAEQFANVERWVGLAGLADASLEDTKELLEALDRDQQTLLKLPRLHDLRTSLEHAGLPELLGELRIRRSDDRSSIKLLQFSWLQSILDHICLADPVIGGFSAENHQRVVEEFQEGDRLHIDSGPARTRRICAEGAIAAREQFKDQEALVKRQAALKIRHLPTREFVRNAVDVLLALKPCWVMSPLMVSQLLPPKKYFDLVIFDEASQVMPADAVSAIVRGEQLVVAGDDKQLPPTAFFASEGGDPGDPGFEEDERESFLAGTAGFESILDALSPLLSFRMLQWHYRSRDESLIAFSNAHFYSRTLTTFAGSQDDPVLRHVLAPWEGGTETNSPMPEVAAVVELIVEHALSRPQESLGVIAMGLHHANRIEERLHQRLRDDPDLARDTAEFFEEDREERFFVKNLERVQGDERDAIILSIGYGKDARGTLPYRFGPLIQDGGERRLNVAITRAKNRLTLVSSFSHRDMDPERSSAEGVELMRQYLQYVDSGGTNFGDRIFEKPALNPFEMDVRDTLTGRGLKLTPQYGTSGYWIDFAVQHPEQPGRHVLAIECDGATYHSSPSARDRDRLRQEQLEQRGWRFHRIWSGEWFHNKEAVVEGVLASYEKALLEGDRLPAPAPADDELDMSSNDPRRDIGARPMVLAGSPIGDYSDLELERLAAWLESDGLLRTEEDLIEEMMSQLGFRRHGKVIVERLASAIRSARLGAQGSDP
jgi:very-short-patch-repair endonuclease